MAIKSGLLQNLSLKAMPLANPAPKRVIALVTRATSAHSAEFEAIAKVMVAVHRKKN
jgi:LysR family hydrogen peroxide-inducible transcriptional activator